MGSDIVLHTTDDAVEESKINTPNSLPVTQDDTSSIENLSVADTWEQNNKVTATPTHNSSPRSPLSNSANNTTIDVSMKSEIRDITDTMDNDINQVLADLQDSPQSISRPLQSDLRKLIANKIKSSIKRQLIKWTVVFIFSPIN